MIVKDTVNGREVEVNLCDRCRCDIPEEWMERPGHLENEGGTWCISCYAWWYAPVIEWHEYRDALVLV